MGRTTPCRPLRALAQAPSAPAGCLSSPRPTRAQTLSSTRTPLVLSADGVPRVLLSGTLGLAGGTADTAGDKCPQEDYGWRHPPGDRLLEGSPLGAQGAVSPTALCSQFQVPEPILSRRLPGPGASGNLPPTVRQSLRQAPWQGKVEPGSGCTSPTPGLRS